MKIVNTSGKLRIYGENLVIEDRIPAGVWNVEFSQFSGFTLTKHEDITINEKIYGPHESKADKVLKSFKLFERNLGVILSGDKGIGKSITAKLISIKGIAAGIPVILVDDYTPGIANFLQSIEQEVIIMFDEFDKTFAHMSGPLGDMDPQNELLTLFDGFSTGKKLFIITCNEIFKLNDFLLNRPGRFHYHFRFDNPTETEIDEYLKDKLNPEYYGEIKSVIGFSRKVGLNFDCLRAIAFELNSGAKFADAISDLNILNTETDSFTILVYDDDGQILIKTERELDPFDTEEFIFTQWDTTGNVCWRFSFIPAQAEYDSTIGGYYLSEKQFKNHIIRENDCCDDDDESDTFDFSLDRTKKMKTPSKVVFKRKISISYKFMV